MTDGKDRRDTLRQHKLAFQDSRSSPCIQQSWLGGTARQWHSAERPCRQTRHQRFFDEHQREIKRHQGVHQHQGSDSGVEAADTVALGPDDGFAESPGGFRLNASILSGVYRPRLTPFAEHGKRSSLCNFTTQAAERQGCTQECCARIVEAGR